MSQLTLKEIAAKVNLSEKAIKRFTVTDEMPDLETLALLCKALDTSADYILGLTDK